MLISLVKMHPGEKGVICAVQGGFGVARRIQQMGLRVGKTVKKEAGHTMKGPQSVLVDNFKIAIGFGMSEKIIVEVKRDKK